MEASSSRVEGRFAYEHGHHDVRRLLPANVAEPCHHAYIVRRFAFI